MQTPFKNKFLSVNLNDQSTNINQFVTSHYINNYSMSTALQVFEFEKKLLRNSFKKEFGMNLPCKSALYVSAALFDQSPGLETSVMKKAKTLKNAQTNTSIVDTLTNMSNSTNVKNSNADMVNANHFAFYNRPTPALTKSAKAYSVRQEKKPKNLLKKGLVCSGIQLLSADWMLEQLKSQFQFKRSTRAVLNSHVRDVGLVMNMLQSACPVLGIRIVATGRLGKRKKGMAQQISRSLGKVPLSTFKCKVDYSQGFVVTSLGLIGLKIWVYYA